MTNTITPDELKALREQLGLTQKEMAEATRVSDAGAIRRYEKGRLGISGPLSLCLDYIMQYGLLPDKIIRKNRKKLKKAVDTSGHIAL